jgi:hypothetical protein
MALFGGTADERREPRSLVEFRAGKMSLSQGVATADKRKGLVYMKTSSDSLLHFCWKDRQTGEVVDDLIIFPGEAEFVTIPQCTTGRVFLLKFKDHSSRKFFYWMQEPSNSKDKELAKKVNELLTNPPEGGGGEGGLPDLPPGYMAIPSSQLQSMLSGGRVDQQQLMELLGGAAGGIPHALAGGGLGRAGGVTAERASSQVSHTPTSSALPTATPRAPNRPTRWVKTLTLLPLAVVVYLTLSCLPQVSAATVGRSSEYSVISQCSWRDVGSREPAVVSWFEHLSFLPLSSLLLFFTLYSITRVRGSNNYHDHDCVDHQLYSLTL